MDLTPFVNDDERQGLGCMTFLMEEDKKNPKGEVRKLMEKIINLFSQSEKVEDQKIPIAILALIIETEFDVERKKQEAESTKSDENNELIKESYASCFALLIQFLKRQTTEQAERRRKERRKTDDKEEINKIIN